MSDFKKLALGLTMAVSPMALSAQEIQTEEQKNDTVETVTQTPESLVANNDTVAISDEVQFGSTMGVKLNTEFKTRPYVPQFELEFEKDEATERIYPVMRVKSNLCQKSKVDKKMAKKLGIKNLKDLKEFRNIRQY